MTESPTLHFIPGQHYECTSCGKCCKGAWNITVDQHAYDHISQSKTFAKKKSDGYIPIVLSDDKRASVGRTSGGECVFLDKEQLCEVHAEIGEPQKPLACQIYPHILTDTPEGFFVSLSFACPAVVENLGKNNAEYHDSLATMLKNHGDAVPRQFPVPQQVELTEHHTIEWKDYLQLETHLINGFQVEAAATSVISLVEQMLWALSHNQMPALLEHGFQQNVMPSSSSEQLRDMFSAHCITIVELEGKPEQREKLFSELISPDGAQSERFACPLPSFTGNSIVEASDHEVLRAYFRNLILGKRLLGENLLNGLLKLAVGLTLFTYYVKAFRDSGRETTALEEAFEIVEGDVVTHSRGLEVLLKELPKALLEALGLV